MVKNPPANVGDAGFFLDPGRCPGEGNDNPLQYSCLGNPMNRGAWRATVHGISRVRYDLATVLSHFSLCNTMDCSSPDKNTGMGCHALLQGIFLTQGSNPNLS